MIFESAYAATVVEADLELVDGRLRVTIGCSRTRSGDYKERSWGDGMSHYDALSHLLPMFQEKARILSGKSRCCKRELVKHGWPLELVGQRQAKLGW